ncbi:sensor histidine kinase [Lentilactobacillus hilgardii]|uniref:sensor histidine kinase n=1 Tax=Lentilactobacillus hilgardii TaxID=1588 RepID=UPI0039EC868E
MVIMLSVVCLILAGLLLLIIIDIKRVTAELVYINAHTTNGFVTANTGLPLIQKLINASNASLRVSRELQQSQVRQENQVRRMLTNLTHDIKTPLTVSMGYVQLLMRSMDTAQQLKLKRIERNLDAVNYYLRYLMDFNLMQEKSIALKVKKINVSALLENELFNYYDEFSQRGLKVTPTISPNLILQTDATLLTRVCQNLIGNILKYGEKEVRVELVRVDDAHVKMTFSNRGRNLPKDPTRLMNRFYTADQARTNQSVGLGLSIVQSLITTLGGRMQLETDAGWFNVMVTLKSLKNQE